MNQREIKFKDKMRASIKEVDDVIEKLQDNYKKNMSKEVNFEQYLEEKFMEDYEGVKDDFEDAFDRFLQCLDVQEVMDYAQQYAEITFNLK